MEKKIKILILEDNRYDIEMIHQHLKRSGLNFVSQIVQTKKTYENALSQFDPSIILSDYSLPSFNGLSAFNIKQIYNRDIPFIVISGVIGEATAVKLIRKGITDYLLKGNLIPLKQKILRALREREERKKQNLAVEKLSEIATLQSHQVRGPIARLQGLINLINFENPSDPQNIEIMKRIQKVTNSFDNMIGKIVRKTNEIETHQ